MRNFMGSRRQGFYEEEEEDQQQQLSGQGKLPSSYKYSSSTSTPSSSSSQHKGPEVPLTYHHNHQRGWLDPTQEETTLRCYNGGGASRAQLELMMMDSSPGNNNGSGGYGGDIDADPDPDDVDDIGRRADALKGGGASSVGGSMGMVVVVEREHMFDKVVTPSDVGKLNRLVIPKQHAEKHFPLDSSTNEKGLLLNFEDRNGKPWRFRYSYWNSSQSYVMTKGWSRFVKEKKLDAGDIVSFQRGVGEFARDRLFIDWRRRPDAPPPPHELLAPPTLSLPIPNHFSFHRPVQYPATWNPLFLLPQLQRDQCHSSQLLLQPNTTTTTNHHPQPHQLNSYGDGYSYCSSTDPAAAAAAAAYSSTGSSYNSVVNPCSGSVIYFRSAAAPQQVGMVQVQRVGVEAPMVFESVPVVQGKAAAKRLRLFGVNMDCPISEESDECDILSSTTMPAHNVNATTVVPHLHQPPPPHLSSPSLLQLRPYNDTPVLPTVPSSSSNMLKKGKASMSLDLDI